MAKLAMDERAGGWSLLKRGPLLDRLAIFASGLCLLHCASTAIALIAFSAIGLSSVSHDFHIVLLALAAPLTLLALGQGVRRHGQYGILLLGGLGLATLFGALMFPHGSLTETGVTIAGSLLIVAAHLLNLKAARARA